MSLDIKKLLKGNIVFFVMLGVLIFVAYRGVLNGEFVTADDPFGIITNPKIKSLTEAFKNHNFILIARALIYKVAGLNSHAYHINSIIFHVINTILVFVLSYTLFGRGVSIITSILFALHPVNTEAVGWLSADNYLYHAFFTFLVLIPFVLYKKTQNRRFLDWSVGIYAMEVAFKMDVWSTLTPVILVIMDQFILNTKISLKKSLYYLPYIGLAAIIILIVVIQQYGTRVSELDVVHHFSVKNTAPIHQRIPYSMYMAAELLIFPKTLTIYHEGTIITKNMFTGMVVASLVIVLLCIYLLKKKQKVYLGLILIIFASISPTFSPVQVAWLAAERYMYVGAAFFCMILALLILKIKNRNIIIAVTALIAVLYFIKTSGRAYEWKTNKGLWLATQKTSPYSYRTYNNLGDVYAQEGNYEQAIKYFEQALKLNPTYAEAVHNIGYTFLRLGNKEMAKKYLTKSVEMNPLLYQSLFKLGAIAYEEKNYEQAKVYFLKSLEVNPGFPPSVKALEVLNRVSP